MILTTHALVGAALGKNISNPLVLIPVSLAVHFFLDSFRHGEYFDSRIATIRNTAWKILLDLSSGGTILLVFLFFCRPNGSVAFSVFLGAFFSLLPDALTVAHWKYPQNKILKKIKEFHSFSHCYGKSPAFSSQRTWTLRNFVNDFLFSVLAILFIFFSRR